MGTLGATLCLATGNLEFSYLRDFYHVCMLLDFRLHEKMSFTLRTAMEKGRQNYQEGIRYLENLGLSLEVQLYKDHANSYATFENIPGISQFFSNPSVVQLMAHHHERIDRSGPSQLSEEEMSDEEWLLVLLDVLLPIQEMNFKVNDGMGFLKKAMHEQALDKILSIRLKNKIEDIFETLPDEAHLASMST